jgi:hypothetical protein
MLGYGVLVWEKPGCPLKNNIATEKPPIMPRTLNRRII